MHTFSCEKAVSAVFSVLLMIIILFVAGIFLYNFAMGMVGNLTASSTTPFSFRIENVAINDSCMTIYVGNWLNQDVTVSKVYINSEPKEIFLSTDSHAVIPKASTGAIQIVGKYVVGCSYDIKLIFTSGNSLISYVRY
jgi:FlaG/FlaF family flagellin (archaellin)